MALSFSLSKRVIDSGPYNFGIALPFICAFYILNSKTPIKLLNIELSYGISCIIRCSIISLYYMTTLFTLAIASVVSAWIKESGSSVFVIIATFFTFLVADILNNEGPGFITVPITMVALYIVLFKFDEGDLSLKIVTISSFAMALFCGTVGILWIFDEFLFSDTIAFLAGLEKIDKHNMHLGGATLLATGYVFIYTTFTINDIFKESDA
jgi:hypothetical protein